MSLGLTSIFQRAEKHECVRWINTYLLQYIY